MFVIELFEDNQRLNCAFNYMPLYCAKMSTFKLYGSQVPSQSTLQGGVTLTLLGSLSNYDGDCNENVISKYNFAFL